MPVITVTLQIDLRLDKWNMKVFKKKNKGNEISTSRMPISQK